MNIKFIVKREIYKIFIEINFIFININFMTGYEFKNKLEKLRILNKQWAIMNGMTEQATSRWCGSDKVPRWASEKLKDWEVYPDLIDDNMRRAGLIKS